MDRNMLRNAVRAALLTGLTATLGACGGGGSGSGSNSMSSGTGTVPVMLSDASSADWACVAVRVLSIALIPQSGGNPVTIWTAPASAPFVNLEQLDQLSEIIGNATDVPVDTYSGALLTIAANPGDVLLTVAANPEAGFPAAAGSTVPTDQIQIQGASGASGARTVSLSVNFDNPLNVGSGQNDGLDLEFDLAHPAFIVGHTPPAADGNTIWAVNFNGPVRPHRRHDLWNLVLRHMYGTVTAVAGNDDAITITKDFPALPFGNPETAIASAQSLTVDVDGANGTIYYDEDAGTRTVIKSFQDVSVSGKYVRIAARYQQDGSLIAVRVWASSTFNKVFVSPEGHVLHVDAATGLLIVQNEVGAGVPVQVTSSTAFYYRQPASAIADATPIGTGLGFLAAGNLVRGFKVHVGTLDPLGAPLTASTIDIETAAYSGSISAATGTGFRYTHDYLDATDDYAVTLGYISSSSANGEDGNNNPITGFKWWNFAYPTLLNDGSGAVTSFMDTVNGGVAFGGSVGTLSAWGLSGARWADPANPNGWSAPDAVIMPTPMPLGTVTTAYADNSFAMTVLGGANPVTVDVSTTAGAATLVYQVMRSNGIVTVAPVDLTMSGGVADLNNLTLGSIVKVYGVPQSDGSLLAYVLIFYSGMMPSS
jgi:Domain of unknown function (DUF4382)